MVDGETVRPCLVDETHCEEHYSLSNHPSTLILSYDQADIPTLAHVDVSYPQNPPSSVTLSLNLIINIDYS